MTSRLRWLIIMRRVTKAMLAIILLTLIVTLIFGVLSTEKLQRIHHVLKVRGETIYSVVQDLARRGGYEFSLGSNRNRLSKRTRKRNHVPNQLCRIPVLDPYHDDVRRYIKYPKYEPCNLKEFAYIEQNTIYVNATGVQDAGFYYINRKPGNDFENELSSWHSLVKPVRMSLKKGLSGCMVPTGRTSGVYIGYTWFLLAENDECTFLKLLRLTEEGLIKHVHARQCLQADDDTRVELSESCNPRDRSFRFSFEQNGRIIRNAETKKCLVIEGDKLQLGNCNKAQTFYMLVNNEKVLSAPLTDEYLKVEITMNDVMHTEYHAHFIRKEKHLLPHSETSLNIAMIMYDSQSHSNAKRHMKKTYSYLSNHPNTFIFDGLTAVGDGTTAQVAAHLTGLAEADLPEARKGMSKAEPVDRYPFIFKQFREAGYVSVFSEDDPWLGAFTYRLMGFKNPPSDKYPRSFWLEAMYLLDKRSVTCTHQKNLKYLRQFFDAYQDVRKFAYFNNARCCHDNIAQVSFADDDTYDLYQFFDRKGYLNNTIVILFGDHGDRSGDFRASLTGKLEERLPLFTLTVPPWFQRKYPEFYKHLSNNQDILTSHFDVYATLRHAMNLTAKPKKYKVHTGYAESFLSPINGTNRTCESAGIENHWCPCLHYDEVQPTDKFALHVANVIVKDMNNLLCGVEEACSKCAKLSLKTIRRAGKRVPRREMQQFVSTKRDDRCDSCGVNLDDRKTVTHLVYELILEASPSGGLFEASATVQFTNSNLDKIKSVTVDPLISRVNRYFDQPACIREKYPHLRNFCYCNVQQKASKAA